MTKQVILTGLRANNDLHIGNYFGALLPIVDMARSRADEYEVNLFVPDLHSFTTPIDHSKLQMQIRHNLRLFAAAGLPLDHPNVHLYRQSYISAHSELTWILDCFTGFGEMRRMTQFKDKSGAQKSVVALNQQIGKTSEALRQSGKLLEDVLEPDVLTETILKTVLKSYHKTSDSLDSIINDIEEYINKTENLAASIGIFNYPVLMAADILLYGATYVPVGEDQTQHLEFARDIAQRMNAKFGELFTVPEPVAKQHEFFGKDQGLRIKDLLDPSKKMSKSDDTGRGCIFLGDDPEDAAKKIMSATTDSLGAIHLDYEKQPGIANLLQILALLQNRPLAEVAAEHNGQERYGDFKKEVAEAVKTFLVDFQTKLAEVNEDKLTSVVEANEAKMREMADATLLRVQKAVGLR